MDSTFKIEKENILNSKEDSIFRCQKCGLIPFIGINIKDDKILVETKCENSHFTKTEINKFLNSFNSNLYEFKCYNCNKQKIDLYYWPDSKKFFVIIVNIIFQKNQLMQKNLIQCVKII